MTASLIFLLLATSPHALLQDVQDVLKDGGLVELALLHLLLLLLVVLVLPVVVIVVVLVIIILSVVFVIVKLIVRNITWKETLATNSLKKR